MELISIITLGGGGRNNFERHFCAVISSKSFEKSQFWGPALEHNFGGQLLGSYFGEYLWGTALGNRFEHSSFGATALRRYFGEQFWEITAGNRFGEQLCGAGLI